MEQVRPSILRRPVKATNGNKETSEEQYRREQEAIAAKGRRMMANEHRLLGSLYPTAEVQQQRLQELERVKQEHLAAQAAERRRQEELLAAFVDSRPTTAPPPARPWEGASLQYAACSQQEARRQFEAEVSEENRRIALAKTLERHQQRQAEVQELQKQLQQPQGSFWNLGAVPATRRFIAPEQRWMSGGGDSYRPLLSRPGSNPGSPHLAQGAGGPAPAPWATGLGCQGLAGATAGAAPAAPTAGGYSGLRTPYATTVTAGGPGAGSSPSAAAAAAKPPRLEAPWATSYSAAAQQADGGLASSRSGRGFGGANNSSSAMAALLSGSGGGGVDASGLEGPAQRPATAAPGGERKYPWEWPGA